MGVEEQKEEREILESIYPEEITGLSVLCNFFQAPSSDIVLPDISDTEFRIDIQLEVTNDDGEDSEPRM